MKTKFYTLYTDEGERMGTYEAECPQQAHSASLIDGCHVAEDDYETMLNEWNVFSGTVKETDCRGYPY